MDLKTRLNDEMKTAMKEKNKIKLSVIRLLKAAIRNTEIEKMRDLNEGEVLELVQKEIKKRKESIISYSQGNRSDLVAREEAEMAILYEFLPVQADDEEIRRVVKEIVDAIPPGEKIHIGKVMPAALSRLKGKADGKRISGIVKEFIP